MALTTAQETALAAHVRANQSAAVVAARAIRNDVELARLYNLASSFIVWRTNVASSEIGKVISYVALAAMTTANQDRLKTFLALNPSTFVGTAGIQQYMDDTFSGALGGEGAATRAALQAMLRRSASLVESVFAAGMGTTASPGSAVFEGTLSYGDISSALNANP